MKKILIKSDNEFLNKEFQVKVGQTYPVQAEGISEEPPKKKYYLINTKNKRAIVMYHNEVEVLIGD